MNNIKKVFISQPMNDKNETDIINERNAAIVEIKKYCNEPVDVIQSYFPDAEKYHPLVNLGKSIQCMADADVVYFCKGWNEARGCRIEHECAKLYHLKIIEN